MWKQRIRCWMKKKSQRIPQIHIIQKFSSVLLSFINFHWFIWEYLRLFCAHKWQEHVEQNVPYTSRTYNKMWALQHRIQHMKNKMVSLRILALSLSSVDPSNNAKAINCTHRSGNCCREWQFWELQASCTSGLIPISILRFVDTLTCSGENTPRASKKIGMTDKMLL